MFGPGHTRPPRWMRLALALSTAPWRSPRDLPAGDAEALRQAVRDGSRLRQASPRWDTIWRPVSGNLAAHRVLLLPARGFGVHGTDLVTLWRARLAAADLLPRAPDPAVLHNAERAWADLIASPWSARSDRSGGHDR